MFWIFPADLARSSQSPWPSRKLSTRMWCSYPVRFTSSNCSVDLCTDLSWTSLVGRCVLLQFCFLLPSFTLTDIDSDQLQWRRWCSLGSFIRLCPFQSRTVFAHNIFRSLHRPTRSSIDRTSSKDRNFLESTCTKSPLLQSSLELQRRETNQCQTSPLVPTRDYGSLLLASRLDRDSWAGQTH